jgi:hypothetical protein
MLTIDEEFAISIKAVDDKNFEWQFEFEFLPQSMDSPYEIWLQANDCIEKMFNAGHQVFIGLSLNNRGFERAINLNGEEGFKNYRGEPMEFSPMQKLNNELIIELKAVDEKNFSSKAEFYFMPEMMSSSYEIWLLAHRWVERMNNAGHEIWIKLQRELPF